MRIHFNQYVAFRSLVSLLTNNKREAKASLYVKEQLKVEKVGGRKTKSSVNQRLLTVLTF